MKYKDGGKDDSLICNQNITFILKKHYLLL